MKLIFLILCVSLIGLILLTGCLQQQACTMEAKICPDGTTVGRTGPNCEFAPCPETQPENNGKTLSVQSKDKATGTIYSTLTLTIPQGALEKDTTVTLISAPAFKFDRFIGGFYIITPQNLSLKEPATISIAFTDDAISINQYAEEIPTLDLTLGYYDPESFTYVPIESTYNKETKTITGKISKFYGDGITIIAKPK